MADVIRSVRVYKIENSGDLVDKCKSDVDILCEYDPQGVNLKIISGKLVNISFFHVYWHRCLSAI